MPDSDRSRPHGAPQSEPAAVPQVREDVAQSEDLQAYLDSQRPRLAPALARTRLMCDGIRLFETCPVAGCRRAGICRGPASARMATPVCFEAMRAARPDVMARLYQGLHGSGEAPSVEAIADLFQSVRAALFTPAGTIPTARTGRRRR